MVDVRVEVVDKVSGILGGTEMVLTGDDVEVEMRVVVEVELEVGVVVCTPDGDVLLGTLT